MKIINAIKAQENLSKLMHKLASSHEPIQIIGDNENSVLISDEDWLAIQETLYLLSIPGMRKSIREGLKTPLKKCSEDLDW